MKNFNVIENLLPAPQNFHENQRSTEISTTATKFPHFVEISTLVATLNVSRS